MNGISLRPDEIRDILINNKRTMRKALKPQPTPEQDIHIQEDGREGFAETIDGENTYWPIAPFEKGDVVYIKEKWAKADGIGVPYVYKADEPIDLEMEGQETFDFYPKWCSGDEMTSESVRLFLRIDSISLEPLHDIYDYEIESEGVILSGEDDADKALEKYKEYWNSKLSEKEYDLYNWDNNPWVWTISFTPFDRREKIWENLNRITSENESLLSQTLSIYTERILEHMVSNCVEIPTEVRDSIVMIDKEKMFKDIETWLNSENIPQGAEVFGVGYKCTQTYLDRDCKVKCDNCTFGRPAVLSGKYDYSMESILGKERFFIKTEAEEVKKEREIKDGWML